MLTASGVSETVLTLMTGLLVNETNRELLLRCRGVAAHWLSVAERIFFALDRNGTGHVGVDDCVPLLVSLLSGSTRAVLLTPDVMLCAAAGLMREFAGLGATAAEPHPMLGGASLIDRGVLTLRAFKTHLAFCNYSEDVLEEMVQRLAATAVLWHSEDSLRGAGTSTLAALPKLWEDSVRSASMSPSASAMLLHSTFALRYRAAAEQRGNVWLAGQLCRFVAGGTTPRDVAMTVCATVTEVWARASADAARRARLWVSERAELERITSGPTGLEPLFHRVQQLVTAAAADDARPSDVSSARLPPRPPRPAALGPPPRAADTTFVSGVDAGGFASASTGRSDTASATDVESVSSLASSNLRLATLGANSSAGGTGSVVSEFDEDRSEAKGPAQAPGVSVASAAVSGDGRTHAAHRSHTHREMVGAGSYDLRRQHSARDRLQHSGVPVSQAASPPADSSTIPPAASSCAQQQSTNRTVPSSKRGLDTLLHPMPNIDYASPEPRLVRRSVDADGVSRDHESDAAVHDSASEAAARGVSDHHSWASSAEDHDGGAAGAVHQHPWRADEECTVTLRSVPFGLLLRRCEAGMSYGAARIKSVDPSKAAAADPAGLRVDDVLVAMDGEDICGLPMGNVLDRMRHAALDVIEGRTATFTFVRQGGPPFYQASSVAGKTSAEPHEASQHPSGIEAAGEGHVGAVAPTKPTAASPERHHAHPWAAEYECTVKLDTVPFGLLLKRSSKGVGGARIKAIAPDMAAASDPAGLLVGDALVAINGEDLCGMSLADTHERLKMAAESVRCGGTAHITFVRKSGPPFNSPQTMHVGRLSAAAVPETATGGAQHAAVRATTVTATQDVSSDDVDRVLGGTQLRGSGVGAHSGLAAGRSTADPAHRSMRGRAALPVPLDLPVNPQPSPSGDTARSPQERWERSFVPGLLQPQSEHEDVHDEDGFVDDADAEVAVQPAERHAPAVEHTSAASPSGFATSATVASLRAAEALPSASQTLTHPGTQANSSFGQMMSLGSGYGGIPRAVEEAPTRTAATSTAAAASLARTTAAGPSATSMTPPQTTTVPVSHSIPAAATPQPHTRNPPSRGAGMGPKIASFASLSSVEELRRLMVVQVDDPEAASARGIGPRTSSTPRASPGVLQFGGAGVLPGASTGAVGTAKPTGIATAESRANGAVEHGSVTRDDEVTEFGDIPAAVVSRFGAELRTASKESQVHQSGKVGAGAPRGHRSPLPKAGTTAWPLRPDTPDKPIASAAADSVKPRGAKTGDAPRSASKSAAGRSKIPRSGAGDRAATETPAAVSTEAALELRYSRELAELVDALLVCEPTAAAPLLEQLRDLRQRARLLTASKPLRAAPPDAFAAQQRPGSNWKSRLATPAASTSPEAVASAVVSALAARGLLVGGYIVNGQPAHAMTGAEIRTAYAQRPQVTAKADVDVARRRARDRVRVSRSGQSNRRTRSPAQQKAALARLAAPTQRHARATAEAAAARKAAKEAELERELSFERSRGVKRDGAKKKTPRKRGAPHPRRKVVSTKEPERRARGSDGKIIPRGITPPPSASKSAVQRDSPSNAARPKDAQGTQLRSQHYIHAGAYVPSTMAMSPSASWSSVASSAVAEGPTAVDLFESFDAAPVYDARVEDGARRRNGRQSRSPTRKRRESRVAGVAEPVMETSGPELGDDEGESDSMHVSRVAARLAVAQDAEAQGRKSPRFERSDDDGGTAEEESRRGQHSPRSTGHHERRRRYEQHGAANGDGSPRWRGRRSSDGDVLPPRSRRASKGGRREATNATGWQRTGERRRRKALPPKVLRDDALGLIDLDDEESAE